MLLSLSMAAPSVRAEPAHLAIPPLSLQVSDTQAKPADGVTELKFGEMFKMPVGPKGLEPSDKLLSLVGKPVRMVGFVAHAEEVTPGMLVLTPMPLTLGDEDEKLADDLPPTAVFVHLSPAYASQAVPNFVGLIRIEGRLELGSSQEADGHASTTRLVLDDATSQLLTSRSEAHVVSATR